jgi:hypothetical protein
MLDFSSFFAVSAQSALSALGHPLSKEHIPGQQTRPPEVAAATAVHSTFRLQGC